MVVALMLRTISSIFDEIIISPGCISYSWPVFRVASLSRDNSLLLLFKWRNGLIHQISCSVHRVLNVIKAFIENRHSLSLCLLGILTVLGHALIENWHMIGLKD